ncbi:MAG: hypothetical protein A4E19_00775 [Nitrospira sp. SG-bin1]|nr:MAG: hypothetical protein A4E19_00775 [Nitrospira sp. SG-bin1]
MASEKAYVPDYKDPDTFYRLNLLLERKSKNCEVWVYDGNHPKPDKMEIKATATLTSDGKGIHFAVHEESGNSDFQLDRSNVMALKKMYHEDKF